MSTLSIAHRGDPVAQRENTLEGFASALSKGADMVEIDLEVTRDGHILVLHDDSLRRMWRIPRLVAELDWSEVASITQDGYRIPDFDELLCEVAVPIMVDFTSAAVVEGALEVARRAGAMDRCLFVTGDVAALAQLRALSPEARIGVTWNERHLPPPGLLESLSAEYFNPYWHLLSSQTVETMHRDGYLVSTWTVDARVDMGELVSMGVDAIVSNRIDDLVDVLRVEPSGPVG